MHDVKDLNDILLQLYVYQNLSQHTKKILICANVNFLILKLIILIEEMNGCRKNNATINKNI